MNAATRHVCFITLVFAGWILANTSANAQGTLSSGWHSSGGTYVVGTTGGLYFDNAFYPQQSGGGYIVFIFKRPNGTTYGTQINQGGNQFTQIRANGVTGSPRSDGNPGGPALSWDTPGTWNVSLWYSDSAGNPSTMQGSTNFTVTPNAHPLTTSVTGNGTITPSSGNFAGLQLITASASTGNNINSFSITQNQNGSIVSLFTASSGSSASYTPDFAKGDVTATAVFKQTHLAANFSVSNTGNKSYDGTTIYTVSCDQANAIWSISFSGGAGVPQGSGGTGLSGSTVTVSGPSTASTSAYTYSIAITGSKDSFAYDAAGSTSGLWTISKAPLTVSAGNASRQYGSANPSFSYSVTGFVNGENASVVSGSPGYSTPATTASSAGTYAITPTVGTLSATNYSFSTFNSGTLTITKAPLTVTANNASRQYGSSNPSFSATYNGFLNGDSSGVVSGSPGFSTSASSSSGVGAYPITPSSGTLSATNYTFNTFNNGTLTITQAPLTVSANNQSRAYGTSNPSFTYNITGFLNGDNSGAVSGSASTSTTAGTSSSVGTYPINISAGTLSATNYYFPSFNGGTLTIFKSTPALSWSAPAAITYGTPLSGAQLNAAASVPGSFSYSPGVGTVLHAGTQTLNVTFTPTDSTDYNSVSTSVQIVVTKAPLTVTANNASKAYGAALPTFSASYSGFVNGDTTSVISGSPALSTTATASSPVNGATGYPISVLIGTLSAADYTFSTFAAGKLTITPYTPTITWASPSAIIYGTALGAAQLNATANDANNAAVAGAYAYTPSSGTVLHAGNQTLNVAFTPTDTTDFNSASGANTLTVNKATLTVAANNQSIQYGSNIPTLSYSITGYVNGDPSTVIAGAPSVTTTATSASPVGNYTIATAVGSLAAADYNFATGNGTLTITAKSETYTIGGNLTTTYDGTAKAVTVTSVPDTGASYTISYTGANGTTYGPSSAAPTNAGTYQVTVNGNGNYSGTATATLTINKVTPTITWATPAAIIYGTPLSGTQLNAVAKDATGTTMTGGTFTYSPAANTVLSAGANQTLKVTFTPSATDSANYDSLGSGSVQITVNKVPLTVTANDATKVYGAALPSFSATYTGFVNGDTSVVVSGSPNFTTAATATSPVGNYAISVSAGTLTATNYTFSPFNPGTLRISQYRPTITWATPTSITYGTALSGTQLNAVAKDVSGNALAGTYTYNPASGTVLGVAPQTLNVSFTASDTTNYNASAVSPVTASVLLTVNKAALTATADPKTMVYGSTVPTLTTSYTGFVNGEGPGNITVPSIATTATSASPVGTYPITLSGGSAANYTLTLVNGNVTVTGKAENYSIDSNTLSQTYDGTPKAVTVTVTPDAGAGYSVTYTGTGGTSYVTSATPPIAAGNYTVNVTASGNYSGSTSGTLTINKAPLTVTANNATRVYGGANPSFSATYSGFVNGENSSVITGSPTFSTTATTSSGVGSSYTITPAIGTLAAANYRFSTFVNGSLSVTPAPLTATANNLSKTYGSANPALTITFSGFVNGDTVANITAPTAATTTMTSSAVGSYPITLTGGSATNYTLTLVNGTLTVNKATLTVTANNQSKVYGAAMPSLTYAITGFVNGDTSSVCTGFPTITTTATSSSAVGTYTITAGVGTLAASNYSFTPANGTLTVTTTALTVTAVNQSKVYGSANPTLTYTLTGFVNGDTSAVVTGTAAVSTTATTSSGAGSYTITLAVGTLSAANYSFGPFVNATLTVTPATLSVSANSTSKTYGAANPAFAASFTGFVNGDGSSVISGAPAFSTTATNASAVGSYPITVAIGTLSASNYTFAGFTSGTLTVNKAALTVAASNQSMVYGAAVPSLTYTITGYVNGDTSAVVSGSPALSTTATSTSSVGAYPIAVSTGTLSASNYTFSSTNGTVTVTQAALTVTADNQSKIYGSANPTLTYTLTGFKNGDTPAVVGGAAAVSTTAIVSSGVGAYTITPAAGTLSAINYSFGPFVNGTLNVTKAPLTVTAANVAKTYGAANPTFSATYSGFANGDTSSVISGAPTFSTAATTSSAAGSYPITPAIGTLTAANYSFGTFVNGTLAINKATLTVTANNQTRTYGSANPTLTYTITGYVNGDTSTVVSGAPTLTTIASTSSAVGSYTIAAATGTLAATNYSFTTANGTLTVTQAPLTVTANNQSKVYGSANPTLTYTLTGFVNGDTATVVTGSATVATPATTSSSVGSYAITPALGTLSAANYSFGPFVSATLSVTPASLTVTASNVSRPYASANPTFSATYTGFVNGDTAAVVSGSPAFSTPATTSSAVGSYPITPSVGTLTATNYSFSTFANGTLSITKVALTATANNQTKVYGAANPTLTIAYTGFVNGDTPISITQPSIATTATTSSAVGSYPISLTGGSATNYTITLVNGTLAVTKASLTVTANDQSKVYGAAVPTLTYTVTGLVNGDTPAVVTGSAAITTAATTSSSVGTYAITPAIGSLAATNYSFGTFTPGTLTVTKASLTATADNQTKVYGSANPTLTISYGGFVNGDTASSITTPIASTTATSSSGVGSYSIALAGGSAANYSLTLVPGTLTVTKAALTVTANNQTRAYGSANPTFTVAYSGFVNGDTTAVLSGSPSVTTVATTSSNVGTYAITAAAGTLSSPNYTFGFVNGTLTISAKAITFTFSNLSYVYDGTQKSSTVTPSDLAATFTADLTKGPDANSYTVSAMGTGNYTGSGRDTLVISAKPVTFTFTDLAYVYDGQQHSATVICSDPSASFTSDVTKGPNANSYAVSANATGNFTGNGSETLVISPAAQTITLTPAPTTTVFAGQPATFTAAGGANGYSWGGNAGVAGSGASVTLTFASPGTYTLTVSNDASNNYTQSNTLTSTITVTSNHVVNSLTPVASSYTIDDANSPMNGQSYGRLWNDGGWTAYLGRSGVKFEVQAQAYPSVKAVELQVKQPGGDWAQLAVQNPTDGATSEDVTFSVMLDSTVPGQPLVPRSYSTGNPLTGLWSIRARVQDANGDWSDFSDEVQVNAVLPIVTKTVSGQTVPPAGALGDWFTASDVKTFSIPLWVP